jgi:DNA-binding NarL/FixJ family response regulator
VSPARILLADDHHLVRHGLRFILDAQPDLSVVAEAGDGADAIDLALTQDVDIAILDITMPRLTGLQAARELTRRKPEVRILLLSMHENAQYLLEAVHAGASGYVLKSAVDQDLVEACRATLRGTRFICPPSISGQVRERVERAVRGEEVQSDPLTSRESEVLKLIAEGHTGKEIAETLVISENTVERHRANILEKLELRDRVELTRYAIRAGLVTA